MQITRDAESRSETRDAGERFRILVREVAQQNAVDHAPDADSRADSDPQCCDDAGGEAGRAADSTQRETKVALDVVDRHEASGVAGLVAEPLLAAERER